MPQQALVIGLGQFGLALTRSLSEKGVETLAVDKRPEMVEQAANIATEVLVADVTDESQLARLAPAKRDVAICAIGDESEEASIICTALLCQMGAPHVIARATDALHRRILRLVGAHEVVHPEEEFGQRLANRIAYRQIISEMPLGDNMYISEIRLPDSYVGKSLAELGLPRRYGVTVVAIRRGKPSQVLRPVPDASLQAGDDLIIVSERANTLEMLKGLK